MPNLAPASSPSPPPPAPLDLALPITTVTDEHEDLKHKISYLKDLYQGLSAAQHAARSTSIKQPAAMAPIWEDRRFTRERLRSAGDRPLMSGVIHAGLINVGSLLGVGGWRGLPKRHSTRTQLAMDPSSAADIIVSIIYQFSPQVLDDFFSASQFVYIHQHDGNDTSQTPSDLDRFAIIRQGYRVKAGFCKDRAASDDSEGLAWTSYVVYDLRVSVARHIWWRQVHLSALGDLLPAAQRDNYNNEPSSALERQQWEYEAVAILAPALVQRRWIQRPGVYRIEVTSQRAVAPSRSKTKPASEHDVPHSSAEVDILRRFADEADVLDTAESLMYELSELIEASKPVEAAGPGSDSDAEASTKSDNTAVSQNTKQSLMRVGVVTGQSISSTTSAGRLTAIPGTEDFDDVAALVQAAEAEADYE